MSSRQAETCRSFWHSEQCVTVVSAVNAPHKYARQKCRKRLLFSVIKCIRECFLFCYFLTVDVAIYFQRSYLNNSIKRTEDSKMGIEREAERGADQ